MAAFRSSLQLNRGLRKWYRRFNDSCDLCWKRSQNFRQFSQVQVNDLQRNEQVIRPNNNGWLNATEKQHCSQVKRLNLSHNLEKCTVDLVRPTKLCVLGTNVTKTSVHVIPFNCVLRTSCSSKLNHKLLGSLRHYFTDEFKGHNEEAGEVMEVKGHSGRADSGSLVIGDIVDDTDKLTGVRDSDQPSDICENNASAEDSQLTSSSHPSPPIKLDSYNLAPFVAKSDVLRFLLHLKVNLAKIEAKPKVANSLVKLDMERDVVPTMLFLKDVGIPDAKLGKVIGLHPFIFEEINKAKLVVEFLKSKKFKDETITHMIVGAPPILGLRVLTIDERIGAYQKFFNLTGDQVRDIMARVPRLLLNGTNELKETIEIFRCYEFSNQQLKKIVLKCPSVFKRPKEIHLQHRLEYLITDIPMTQNTIAEFSYILLYPTNPIKERHHFLLELGRAQYDPTKESYISPTDLVCTPERQFCKLARTTVAVFKAFKMTL